MSWVMLLGGGVLLYLGAEWLVGGASGLARRLGVPQLLVGLTVVAYGTSAPEVVVGIKAAADGAGGVALGNVVGSNIANLGLILGLTVLFKPARVDRAFIRREVPVLLVATLSLPLVLLDGVVSRVEGVALLACALAYTVWMVSAARRSKAERAQAVKDAAALEEASGLAGAPHPKGTPRLALTAVVGLGLLVGGGSLFVDGAVALATSWGVSGRIIGLTVVAIGTSLPELATSLIAAWRGHSDLAVGNVVGSNIFNALLCLGAAAAIAPVKAPAASMELDLGVMLGLTLFAAVALRRERVITRLEGAALFSTYLGFLGALSRA